MEGTSLPPYSESRASRENGKGGAPVCSWQLFSGPNNREVSAIFPGPARGQGTCHCHSEDCRCEQNARLELDATKANEHDLLSGCEFRRLGGRQQSAVHES